MFYSESCLAQREISVDTYHTLFSIIEGSSYKLAGIVLTFGLTLLGRAAVVFPVAACLNI